jgi:hypothetical protein
MNAHTQKPTGIPQFSCEPARPVHSKAFSETAKALKATLGATLKLVRELLILIWKFVSFAALLFWEIKGRCWWSIARDFTKKGYRAVKKDAFNG